MSLLFLESSHGNARVESGPPATFMLFAAEVVVVVVPGLGPQFICITQGYNLQRTAHGKANTREQLMYKA